MEGSQPFIYRCAPRGTRPGPCPAEKPRLARSLRKMGRTLTCNFFPLFRLQSYNFFPIKPSVFCNFLPIEVLIVIKLPVSNHISFGLRLVSGMTGCIGDEVGQTSSISMAFKLEVILRSSRSVFNDHITVKFVLKLFQIYITSDYFLYLCNGLTSIAIPEANDYPTGVSIDYGL